MVDPLTTFAAAGNALQFVQLGVDLLRKTIEYSHGGGNSNFQTLQDCAQRLSVSSARLQRSMESGASQLLHPGPARALRRANLECLRLSRELTAILNQLGFNRPHSLWSSEDGRSFLEKLERTLMSRGMGLLEIDPTADEEDCEGDLIKLRPATKIEFLHRTVRDYFAGPAGRRLLHKHTGGPFDAYMFQCNLMAISVRTFVSDDQWFSLTNFSDAVDDFLLRIMDRQVEERMAFVLFEKVVELFDEHGEVLSDGERWEFGSFRHIGNALRHWLEYRSNAVSLAIQLGWKPYVKARLTTTAIQEKEGRPLLFYALRASKSHGDGNDELTLPDLDILSDLLRLGASPDSIFVDGEYHIPLWAYFLQSIQFIEELDYAACLEIVKLFLLHGIRTVVTEADLVYVYGECLSDSNGWGFEPSHEILQDPQEFVQERLTELRTSSLEIVDGADSYSFLEVPQSLARVAEDSEHSLFAEADIVAFKGLESSQHRKVPSLKQPALGKKRARESSTSPVDRVRLELNKSGLGDDGEQPLYKKTRRSSF
ncbi:uncharacterized protein Z520_01652 [Fonsecaea multimorphosa CBS 102226]|uniref:DUF7791 domain-containing protein n=1 Tax=Fonsecaea multimorphosa CBS 102226 TaxID=1442371 RepID=A0A0D2KI79_9EURO|nr:uncharacterized protein Z520_01652 [Fonsecaea multimorphosa CBS 102226]KIY03185.1 hypothetical protein Z520_01652 [Fonsecaea multimorphosa CBS 102226]